MGGLNIFGPHRSPTGTKSDGGGGRCEKNPTEAETTHLMQNWVIFCYFKHSKIQLLKVLLSLKVAKFDTKMYLNFSNFRGRTSAGGGEQALVQKRGQVSDGGLTKFLPDGDRVDSYYLEVQVTWIWSVWTWN